MTKIIIEARGSDQVRSVEDLSLGAFFRDDTLLYLVVENDASVRAVKALSFQSKLFIMINWGRKVIYVPEVKISYRKETL